jgi:hypothetical protein
MHGAIHPLPQYAFKAWCSVEKHRDNFTFNLTFRKPPPFFANFCSVTRVYPKVSGLAACCENGNLYSFLPLGAVVSLFVSQSSEFCRHNTLCCVSMNVYCCTRTFGYALICIQPLNNIGNKCGYLGDFGFTVSNIWKGYFIISDCLKSWRILVKKFKILGLRVLFMNFQNTA